MKYYIFMLKKTEKSVYSNEVEVLHASFGLFLNF